MRAFAQLYRRLDETTRLLEKVAALVDYFRAAEAEDAAWAIYFLSGEKLRPTLPSRLMRMAAIEASGMPEWLFEETYHWVGDLAETIACIVPEPGEQRDEPLAQWSQRMQAELRGTNDDAKRERLLAEWRRAPREDRFVMNKLLTGGLRVGVSRKLLTRALAEVTQISAEELSLRLMGTWDPTAENYERLIAHEAEQKSVGQPYPFCLAHPLPGQPEELGPIEDMALEWKWDGIRAQLIRRGEQFFVWSRGEELMAGRFPELESAMASWPEGTALDGEILAWKPGGPRPFSDLQRRLNRKQLTPRLLRDFPVIFVAFDLLEWAGVDLRQRPWSERRAVLESWLPERQLDQGDEPRLGWMKTLVANDWTEAAAVRQRSREVGAEGLMLKRHSSRYEVGRVTGAWWKWKVEPYTIDAVLIYAQRGHGRRAMLYTDYTFAVWDEGQLVPFAKAFSGLTDAEIREVDRHIRDNTLDTFGPVRAVKPTLVMELAFENVQLSSRHKSGVAVRFPRIVRMRPDKTIDQADTLAMVKARIAAAPTP